MLKWDLRLRATSEGPHFVLSLQGYHVFLLCGGRQKNNTFSVSEEHLLECEQFFNNPLLLRVLQSKAGSSLLPYILGFYTLYLCWVAVSSLNSDSWHRFVASPWHINTAGLGLWSKNMASHVLALCACADKFFLAYWICVLWGSMCGFLQNEAASPPM